jgi:sugar (pentulose or hexulose) kinase
MLADVLEFPLHAVDVPAASGRGAALLGASAAGLISLREIEGPLAPPARLVAEPDPAGAAFHRERHARFRSLIPALKFTGAAAGRAAGPSDGAEGAA